MKNAEIFVLVAALLSASAALAAPADAAAPLGTEDLTAGSWIIRLSPGARDDLRFFAIDPADANRLYLRRFATPSFYLDALSDSDLKVLLWPEAKKLGLSFSSDGASFVREISPIKIEYMRSSAPPSDAVSPYIGDWEIGRSAMTVSIRACEKRAWTVAMYFPGDPLSAIPMGYYPLSPTGDGRYRSSASFPDSCIELEYDRASDALILRPLFKERPFADVLYDPVRAWRGK